MTRPHLSVRARLTLLCFSLVCALAASNLLLGYLINRDNAAQIAQQEQYRRFQIFEAADQAWWLYRHKASDVNVAIMMKNPDARARAEKEKVDAATNLDVRLGQLATFDPASVKVIRESLEEVPKHIQQVTTAYLNGNQAEAAPSAFRLQQLSDQIQATLRTAYQRERTNADEIQIGERKRVQSAITLANMISIAAGVIGLLLTLMVVRSIIRPLQDITIAIRQVNSGKTDIAMPPISPDEFGDIALALRQFRDRAEHLQRLAYWDPLTGLGNRAQLEENLRNAIQNCLATDRCCALIYFNLDNFRAVNDRLGHQAGDSYLCEAVARMSRSLPADAILCRYAGDNFTVLVEGLVADAALDAQLRDIADCSLRALAEPYQFGEHVLNMSASIGIAAFPRDGETVEQLIVGADAAMYAAKKNGRNNVRFAGSQITGIMRRQLAIANEIRVGIERGEFEPYYQPIIDIDKGCVIGAEALLRWHHPQRGLLLPSEFIHIAEEEGLIGKLGLSCMKLVHQQRLRWAPERNHMRFSVNLSVRQVNDRAILRTLQEFSGSPDILTPRIDFEITESALLDSSEHGPTVLGEIRTMGYRLGLDDFGTGYSSFSYLHRLPIDKIKIDKQFVSNMNSSRQAMAIVNAIVALARSLEMEVIAEGVETAEQMIQLSKLGCNLQQGFYFTWALPGSEFDRWVVNFERHDTERAQQKQPSIITV